MTSAAGLSRQASVRLTGVSVDYRIRTSVPARGPAAVRSLVRRGDVVRALDDVSLELGTGDVVALVGGNGAGKSTLLRTMAGLTPATSGLVEASSRPLLLSVGAAMLPELSGRRNALLGCLAQGMAADAASEAVDGILAFAGLAEAADRPLGTYSTGMAARLRFAVATVQQREILLVDEALSVGDAAFAARSRERMETLASASGTVVLVSHSMGFLSKVCTRAVWLDAGRVRADGPVEDVVAAYLQAGQSADEGGR